MTAGSKHREHAAVVIWKLNAGLTAIEPVCDLFDATGVSWELNLNGVGLAEFSIPITDPMAGEVQRLRYAELWEGDRRVELFRIDTIDKSRSDSAMLEVQCTHVLDTLNDKVMKGIHTSTGTVATMAYLMAQQDLAQWQTGTIDFADAFTHAWTNFTIWRAIMELPKQWAVDMVVGYDTTTYPWTLDLLTPPTIVVSLVQEGKNLASITRREEARKLVSRLYAYGKGAGTQQLTIASQNVTGSIEAITAPAAAGQKVVAVLVGASFTHGQRVYIQSNVGLWENNEVDTVAGNNVTMLNNLLNSYVVAGGSVSVAEEYVQDAALWAAGVRVTRVLNEQTVTGAAQLKAIADATLLKLAAPWYTYTMKMVDLSRLAGLAYGHLHVGTMVRLYDTKIGRDVEARIVKLKRSNVDGRPGDITVTLTNRLDEFPGYGDAAYANNLDGVENGNTYGRILATSIFNGRIILSETVGNVDWANIDMKPDFGDLVAMADDPTISSLYLSALYMGFWNGTEWRAYIKGDGTFKFYIGATDYIQGAGGVVTIRGDLNAGDITAGALSADRITVGTLNFNKLTASSISIINSMIASGAVTPGKISINSTLDFLGQDAWNVAGIRGYTGTASCWIDLRNNQWIGYSSNSYLALTQDVFLRGSRDATIDAQAGTLYLRSTGSIAFEIAGSTLLYMNSQSTTGGSWGHGWISCSIGGVVRYIKLDDIA